ncbi:MAG: lipopolysaccharide kinase InaA family protein [Gammaproteobacteria bacterium]
MLAGSHLSNNISWVHDRTFFRYCICQQRYYTSAMQDFLRAPDDALAHSRQFFKNIPGDTSTVAVVRVNGVPLVVKRYNVKGFWHGLKLLFRPSRAMISWRNANRLRALNIPTIEPVAVLEKRLGLFRRQAYFISRYVVGLSGSDYFAHQGQSPEACVVAITAIVNILRQLGAAKIHHNDFHHSNFIMVGNQPLLIDLDHMRQYRYSTRGFAQAHQKDIAQFRHYLAGNTLALELFEKALQSLESCRESCSLDAI